MLGKLKTGGKCLFILSGPVARLKGTGELCFSGTCFFHEVTAQLSLVHGLKDSSLVKARVQEVRITLVNTFCTSVKRQCICIDSSLSDIMFGECKSQIFIWDIWVTCTFRKIRFAYMPGFFRLISCQTTFRSLFRNSWSLTTLLATMIGKKLFFLYLTYFVYIFH